MKKFISIISVLLAVIILACACSGDMLSSDSETQNEEASSNGYSGDLAYFANMFDDESISDCKNKKIEVSGEVSTVLSSIVYLGDANADGIEVHCSFAYSDNIDERINEGDCVTITGTCTSIFTYTKSIQLNDCVLIDTANSIDTEENTDTEENNTTESIEETTAHIHAFSNATCDSPKICECGETEGEALGHNWESATCWKAKTCLTCGATDGGALAHSWAAATCTTAKTCSSCGTTEGSPTSHNYVSGYCSYCGAKDPNYSSGPMVWIPSSGKKYHSNPNCSGMKNPRQISLEDAQSRGYTPCKNCY